MKFEDVLGHQRLPIDEEATVPELEKVIKNPTEVSTPELVEAVESAADQATKLESERYALSEISWKLRNNYQEAENHLKNFKTAKANLKESLEKHADDASKIGVHGITEALTSKRLERTDEVKGYSENRKKLRETVKKISELKSDLKKQRFEGLKGLSFTANKVGETEGVVPKRRKSVSAIYDKESEISGSQKALARDVGEVMPELVKRAEAALKEKRTAITSDPANSAHSMQNMNLEGRKAQEQKIVNLLRRAVDENAVEFGIEANEIAVKNIDIKPLKDYENFPPERIEDKDSWEYKELDQGLEKAKVSLEGLKARESEIVIAMRRKYEISLDLDHLPINFEVITPNGYQGLGYDEGETVAHAFVYEGLDEFKKAEKDLEEKRAESSKIRELRTDLLSDVQDSYVEMSRSLASASFFNFALKKKLKEKYAIAEKKLDEFDQLQKVRRLEIDNLEKKLSLLQSNIKCEKVPLNILDLVQPIELVNYYYIHKNYGRGYEKSRSENPMQTVRDFFKIFKEKRLKEIAEFEEKKKRYEKEHSFATYEALDKKNKRREGRGA